MAYYREIARGQIRGDTTGRLKLLFDPTSKELLGVHIIGEGASEVHRMVVARDLLGGQRKKA